MDRVSDTIRFISLWSEEEAEEFWTQNKGSVAYGQGFKTSCPLRQ